MAQLSSAKSVRLTKFGLRLNKKVAVVCVAVVVLATLVGGIWLTQRSGQLIERADTEAAEETAATEAAAVTEAADESATTEGVSSLCVVHVDGAVLTPGVYRLQGTDLRLQDAVDAAGGLLTDADTTSVNLAALLEDGAKVYIPYEGEVVDTSTVTAGQSTSSTTDTSSESSLININTATASELEELPGVGPATAEAIIQDREQNGPFSSPEDIMRVSGIGEKKYAKMEGLICV